MIFQSALRLKLPTIVVKIKSVHSGKYLNSVFTCYSLPFDKTSGPLLERWGHDSEWPIFLGVTLDEWATQYWVGSLSSDFSQFAFPNVELLHQQWIWVRAVRVLQFSASVPMYWGKCSYLELSLCDMGLEGEGRWEMLVDLPFQVRYSPWLGAEGEGAMCPWLYPSEVDLLWFWALGWRGSWQRSECGLWLSHSFSLFLLRCRIFSWICFSSFDICPGHFPETLNGDFCFFIFFTSYGCFTGEKVVELLMSSFQKLSQFHLF